MQLCLTILRTADDFLLFATAVVNVLTAIADHNRSENTDAK
jgi:hypothetical protein